jgi:hypothetical protein
VLPIYIFGLILPRSKHDIYGSFSGQRIGDNAWFAFTSSNVEKRYFITKSKSVIRESNNMAGIVYCYSPRGLFLQLTAKRAFFSHSIEDFFAPAIIGATVVALGHGIPIKKSAAADRDLKWIHNRFMKFIILGVFPYLYHYYCNEVHSPSEFFDSMKMDVYGFSNPSIVRAEMPRIRVTPSIEGTSSRRILFAPTFRKNQTFELTLRKAGLFRDELLQTLNEAGIELWIKPHYHDAHEAGSLKLPKGVGLLEVQDLNSHLGEFQALVTDYSSVFYDATQAGLPVVFVIHDLQAYQTSDTELFDWYRQLATRFGSISLNDAIVRINQGSISCFMGLNHPGW